MSLSNLFVCFLSVVIVSDTLKFFHGRDALLYELDTSLLEGNHSLVFYCVFLHFFCSSSGCDHLSHVLIYYEDFMDSYCELMEKYNDDPATYMAEYLEMNEKYVTVMEELDAIDEDELTDEEEAYYLEVMARINSKLLEVAN